MPAVIPPFLTLDALDKILNIIVNQGAETYSVRLSEYNPDSSSVRSRLEEYLERPGQLSQIALRDSRHILTGLSKDDVLSLYERTIKNVGPANSVKFEGLHWASGDGVQLRLTPTEVKVSYHPTQSLDLPAYIKDMHPIVQGTGVPFLTHIGGPYIIGFDD